MRKKRSPKKYHKAHLPYAAFFCDRVDWGTGNVPCDLRGLDRLLVFAHIVVVLSENYDVFEHVGVRLS